MDPRFRLFNRTWRTGRIAALACAAAWSVIPLAAQESARTFATPEEAVRALAAAVKAGDLPEVIALFAPYGKELAESSDPATGRQNRQIFVAAFAEGWHLVNQGASKKTLVIGNEEWPLPVPLIKTGNRWRFDSEAGKEEVLARRIGRNELAAIAICHTYVAAQRRYAAEGHDGKPAGAFATKFRSDPGKHDGLYWPEVKGQPRSPLGDLLAEAAEGEPSAAGKSSPIPFHGYYFKILTDAGASGGAPGVALIAWPAQYDATGVMTFLVNQSGVVRQKDVGPDTDAKAKATAAYKPDASWTAVK
jgi:Protein of unknown function (DUF2950)